MNQPPIAATVNTPLRTNRASDMRAPVSTYNSIESSASRDLESNTPSGCLANTTSMVRRNMCLIVGVPLTISLLGGAIALCYYLAAKREEQPPPSEEEKQKQAQLNFFMMMCILSSIWLGNSTDSSRESSSGRR